MVNTISVDCVNLTAYTPAETTELVSRAGVKKGNTPPHKIVLSSPWYQENAPGLIKIVGALVFPVGLVMVALTGADLNIQFTTVAALHRRLPVWKMLLHWTLCFLGNLAGSLFLMSVVFGYGGVFNASPYKEEVIAFATKKQVAPQWHEIFLRAIGCNWLVCLALFLGTQGKDLGSKVIGLWLPIFSFVALGLDHVIANMFFIPLGIWLHTPGLTVGLYIWKGIIPATLGNILGGGLFCGVYYWYMYLCMEPPVKIDGAEYLGHAIEHTLTHTLTRFRSRRMSAATDEETRIGSRDDLHHDGRSGPHAHWDKSSFKKTPSTV